MCLSPYKLFPLFLEAGNQNVETFHICFLWESSLRRRTGLCKNETVIHASGVKKLLLVIFTLLLVWGHFLFTLMNRYEMRLEPGSCNASSFLFQIWWHHFSDALSRISFRGTHRLPVFFISQVVNRAGKVLNLELQKAYPCFMLVLYTADSNSA